MDMDAAINADNEEKLQIEETDDSCRLNFTGSSCTTECVSGDCSAEVKQEIFAFVKQEPDDVGYVI